MRYRDAFLVALRGLTAHRMRSLLTVLGVVIGVGAVISLLAIGTGAQQAVTSQIQGLGSNLLFVYPGATTQSGVRGAVGTSSALTLEDAKALADPVLAPSVAAVAPQVRSFAQVVAGGQNTNAPVTGVTPEYLTVRNFTLAQGDFISQQQVESRARVAVLGSQVAETLFPGDSPLDQWVRVGGQRLRVIGVLESKGGSALGMDDNTLLIPITTFQISLARQRTAQGGLSLQQINVQATSQQDMDLAAQEVTAVLQERHRADDFTIVSQEDILRTVNQTLGVFTIFLGAIAGISLLVGGIGIMNIMLVSVTERTREIGIRKAVGAKRRNILLQFLLEATFLSLVGGGLGVLLGVVISRLVRGISLGAQTVLQPVITLPIVLLAFSLAAAIGIFFGAYPASRASRLDPIEALRHE